MELLVILIVSVVLGGGIKMFTPPKSVAPTTSTGTVDLRSTSPISAFYEVASPDAPLLIPLAPAPGLYPIGTMGLSRGPTGMIDGPPVPRTTYIVALARDGSRASKQVTVSEGMTTVVDFGLIVPAVVVETPPAAKPTPTFLPARTVVQSTGPAVPSLRVLNMPHGGRVYVNSALVGGRWEDEPAKTMWRVSAPLGMVAVDVVDAAGARRTASVTIPDPMTASDPVTSFATVNYLGMSPPSVPAQGAPSGGLTLRDPASTNTGGPLAFSPVLDGLAQRAGGLGPAVTLPIPVLFTGGFVGAGVTVPSRFKVTFVYEPGTYFHRDQNGFWDRAFRLSVARGPKVDGIDSETRFVVTKVTDPDPRMSRAAYDAREPFMQVAYLHGTAQRAYLDEGNNSEMAASLWSEPGLPIASKSARRAVFQVEAANGRLSITNSFANDGIEDTIGVRRSSDPNVFVITRPPTGAEVTANYVAIGRGETVEFTLSTANAGTVSGVVDSIVAFFAQPPAPAPAPSRRLGDAAADSTLFASGSNLATRR